MSTDVSALRGSCLCGRLISISTIGSLFKRSREGEESNEPFSVSQEQITQL